MNIQAPLPESWSVLLHRQRTLETAGYPVDWAMYLAELTDIDLHLACDLLKRGATLDQALGILL